MEQIKLEQMLLLHQETHPRMVLEDAVRLIYESAFGPGIRPEDPAEAVEDEGNRLTPDQLARPYTETLGGGYCRMNLSVLQMLPATALGRMVEVSRREGDRELYHRGLGALERLCSSGALAFSHKAIHTYKEGEPVRPAHSAAYQEAYSPAYRVVREELGNYLTLIVKICRLLNRTGEVTVAIDGQSAAGKSTLATLLEEVFSCNVFRTETFIEKGLFDYRRFEKKVLSKLNTGKPFQLGGKQIMPRRLNVVEGLYSMHPSLEKYYELKVFMGVSPLLQSERILQRAGESQFGRYAGELIPRENAYLNHMNIELKCDLAFHN